MCVEKGIKMMSVAKIFKKWVIDTIGNNILSFALQTKDKVTLPRGLEPLVFRLTA